MRQLVAEDVGTYRLLEDGEYDAVRGEAEEEGNTLLQGGQQVLYEADSRPHAGRDEQQAEGELHHP